MIAMDGRRFYPFANAEIDWNAFEAIELERFASRAELEVVLCRKEKSINRKAELFCIAYAKKAMAQTSAT